MRYIIIDADGLITNAIEWDGVAEWAPPEGSTAVESDAGSSGDSYIDGVFTRAQAPVVDEPSIADQVAAMQAQLAALLAKVK